MGLIEWGTQQQLFENATVLSWGGHSHTEKTKANLTHAGRSPNRSSAAQNCFTWRKLGGFYGSATH